MADVLIVCVREDEVKAKSLADLFEREGFTVGGAPSDENALRSCGAIVVVWSQASIRSRPFLDAAQRAVSANKAVIACLIDPPPSSSLNQSPAFELKTWDGTPDDPVVDGLFFAVDRMVNGARGAEPPAHHQQQAQPQPQPYYPPQAPAAAAPTYAPQQPPQQAYAPQPAPYAPPPHAYAPPQQAYVPQPAYPPPQQAYAPQPAPYAPPPQPQPQQQAYAPQPQAAPAPQPAPELAPQRTRRSAAAAPAAAQDASDPMSAEALRWRAIRHSRDPASFLHYLSEYGPEGAFSELAELRLKQLEDSNTTSLKNAAKQQRAPEPAPRAEPRRNASSERERQREAEVQRERDLERQRELQEIEAARAREARERETREARAREERPAPAPARRPEPRASARGGTVRPQAAERRDPRDYRPERRAGGGGALRFVFVFALLGATAVGAGMYLGAGQRMPDTAQQISTEPPGGASPMLAATDASSLDPTLEATNLPPATAAAAPAPMGGPTPVEEAAFDAATAAPVRAAPPRVEAPRPAAPAREERRREPAPARFQAASATAEEIPLMPRPIAPPATTQLASLEPTAATPVPEIARQGAVQWALRPSAILFTSSYPEAARRASVDGRARLNCTVRSDLGVDCSVSSETPAGFGFGPAALRVVRGYRAQAQLDDGASAVGATTNITVAFRAQE